ncbi:hypothetical protein, partial [Pseudomonas syringae group genomosp. 7]|uniref:hypothetical protein n=1 Tax=Pseudomonas syringae group genomosp. 7 TaxID=251699 RepID=UPI001B312F5E
RSGLVRELPGTGSKTDAYGTSGATEITCLRAASQPFADKSAPTPSGPKPNLPDDVGIGRRFACTRYLGFVGADLSANCREPAAKRSDTEIIAT